MLVKENDFINYTFKDAVLYITIKKKSEPTDEEWEFSKSFIQSFYVSVNETENKFSILFDLRNLCILSFTRYKEWADLFIKNKELTRKYVYSTSIINTNTIIKAAINIFFTMYSTERPIKLTSNLKDSLEFINSNSPQTINLHQTYNCNENE
jgi:hypothetical protein